MSKRLKSIEASITSVPINAALSAVVGGSGVKFDETVDVAIRLGIDPRKSDQNVRGSAVLPSGTGKTVRVAVVAASEDDQNKAKEANAEVVGFEDLIKSIGDGNLDFDVLLATPDSMRHLSSVAKVLGPRGLMPNPKSDTVVKDVVEGVRLAKAGQVRFRADKYGIIHAPIGKASFSVDALKQNFESIVAALKKAKPNSSKGIYLTSSSVSCTMGRSVRVDIVSYR